jgi:hypothetical protein
MDPSLPKVALELWRADAIVLFDWLMTVDIDSVPSPIRQRSRRSPTC